MNSKGVILGYFYVSRNGQEVLCTGCMLLFEARVLMLCAGDLNFWLLKVISWMRSFCKHTMLRREFPSIFEFVGYSWSIYFDNFIMQEVCIYIRLGLNKVINKKNLRKFDYFEVLKMYVKLFLYPVLPQNKIY